MFLFGRCRLSAAHLKAVIFTTVTKERIEMIQGAPLPAQEEKQTMQRRPTLDTDVGPCVVGLMSAHARGRARVQGM